MRALAALAMAGLASVLLAAPTTLTPQTGAGKAFAVAGAFKLGPSLPPGRYVLQLAALSAADGKTRGASRALQQMDFDVKQAGI